MRYRYKYHGAMRSHRALLKMANAGKIRWVMVYAKLLKRPGSFSFFECQTAV